MPWLQHSGTEKNGPAKTSGAFHKMIYDYFSAYYGKDVSLPRVQKFLNWLKKNDAALTERFMEERGRMGLEELPRDKRDESTAFSFVLGVWLGGRYLSQAVEPEAKMVRYPLVRYEAGYNRMGRDHTTENDVVIRLGDGPVKRHAGNCESVPELFVAAINIGIHEHSHGIPYMTWPDYAENHADEAVSELGACYAQDRLSLPVKNKRNAYLGVRDLSKNMRELIESGDADGLRKLFREYIAFAIFPWIKGRLGSGMDLRRFSFKAPDDYMKNRRAGHIDDLAGMREKPFDAESFFEMAGMRDGKLKADLRSVFSRLPSAKEAGVLEFFEAFVREMDAEFGMPPKPDYPDEYSLNAPVEREGWKTPLRRIRAARTENG